MSKSIESADSLFELGKLYKDRGDFDVAIEKLSAASEQYIAHKKFQKYLECQNMLLRMYAEREDTESVTKTKELLQDLIIKEGLQLDSKLYYTLGICAHYKEQLDLALEYHQKALALALAEDNKEDMCYAINGIAIVYFNMGRYPDALKEIYNLQVFFEFLNLPELKLATQVLNGLIFRDMERYDQALELLWQAHESLKVVKHFYTYLNLLFALGTTYQKSGNLELARMYLVLAKRSTDPKNLKQLSRQIEAKLHELGVKPKEEFDIIFDSGKNAVIEKKKGSIDFKNQFILLDLLHLFLKTPGKVYPKEELVKRIWSQDYDPAVHDNKIYVTIKRLRKMIEPDYDKPKYIFRSKNGYYLNKTVKVHMEQQ